MTSVARLYTREILSHLGYSATWLPTVPLKLGTVGTIEGEVFVPRFSIEQIREVEIPFSTVTDRTKDRIQYQSSKGVAVEIKFSGEVDAKYAHVPEAKAGFNVSFSGKSGVLFAAIDCCEDRIADQRGLARAILELQKMGEWRTKYVVVTHLVRARACTIFLASSAGAHVSIALEADIRAGTMDIANVELGPSVVFSKDMQTQIVAQQGLTPLFRGAKVKRGLTGRRSVGAAQQPGSGTFYRSRDVTAHRDPGVSMPSGRGSGEARFEPLEKYDDSLLWGAKGDAG